MNEEEIREVMDLYDGEIDIPQKQVYKVALRDKLIVFGFIGAFVGGMYAAWTHNLLYVLAGAVIGAVFGAL